MTKEQTNNWEEEFNAVFGEYWTKIGENLYQAFPHSDRTPIFVSQEGIKNFISKTISQEKEKWELETKKYRQITNLITSIFYYGNFKAETPNERELEKLLVDLNLWPTNEQIIIKRTDLLQNK